MSALSQPASIPALPATPELLTRLPPGLKGGVLDRLHFLFDTYNANLKALEKFGDPFTLVTPAGVLVLTGTPDGVREIFSADSDTFEPFGTDVLGAALGDNSLILLWGPRHRRERKLLTPPFHGERMRSYGRIIQDVTLRHAAQWELGRTFNITDGTQAISLDVILRAVFGIVDDDLERRFSTAIVEAIRSFSPLIVFFKQLRVDLGRWSPGGRFHRKMAAMNALIYEELEARRSQDLSGRDDILSLLLSARDEEGQPMTDLELRDELVTMIIAGHETTGTALSWALYWIHRTEGVLERLMEELRPLGPKPDPEALARLPYLGAVCQETLRVFPILPFAPRRLRVPFTLRGYEIPPGVAVGASISLLHHNPEIYPEPFQFRPERFLERQFSPFEFLPFGGGVRKCIGAPFALYEMKVVLGSLLSSVTLALKETQPVKPVRRNITLGPRRVRMARVT